MFVLRPEMKSIQVNRNNIVNIIASINSPMVAAEGMPLEPAKAFVIGVINRSNLFSIYIYLHLVQSHKCLIYLHDTKEIPREYYREQEQEASQFVENMGFMLDNVNFRKLTPEQQDDLMRSLPLFYDDLEAFHRRNEPENDGVVIDMSEEEVVNLQPLSEDVIELEDIAEAVDESMVQQPGLSPEGIAKIVRLLSSF